MSDVVVCRRADGTPDIVSDKLPCSKCGADLWVSPASVSHLARTPDAVLMCVETCLDFQPGDVLGVLPETLLEVDAVLRSKATKDKS